MEQLSRMLLIATQRHQHQYDKAGQPYILHCLKVMHYTKTTDPELMCISLGHDLFEDTFNGDTLEGTQFLEAHGFSQRVTRGISLMTKIKGQSYEAYKRQVKSSKDSVIVKMADLRHNSDIRRLKGVTEKDLLRTQKYHEFYQELKEILEQRSN
jgi:(p)ppGpp synthase/HD superfamily hydrolase